MFRRGYASRSMRAARRPRQPRCHSIRTRVAAIRRGHGIDRESRRNDAELARRIAAGEGDALGAAFERHAARLHRMAYGITGSIGDAEDLVQDVFVALPETAATFEARGSFGAWLARITVRAALMRVRTERGRRELLTRFLAAGEPQITERPLNRVLVERALNRMSSTYRSVLWLRAVEGWRHREIAEALEISEATAAQRFHRARVIMADLIEEG